MFFRFSFFSEFCWQIFISSPSEKNIFNSIQSEAVSANKLKKNGITKKNFLRNLKSSFNRMKILKMMLGKFSFLIMDLPRNYRFHDENKLINQEKSIKSLSIPFQEKSYMDLPFNFCSLYKFGFDISSCIFKKHVTRSTRE